MTVDLSRCWLYGIIDLGYIETHEVSGVARAMIAGGVDIVQLRGKQQDVRDLLAIACELHAITREAEVPLVINDHAEVAREAGAEGVHVGQDDLSIARARAITDEKTFVGKSTHSHAQALAAAAEGADYIGFGPLFPTPTKPDYRPIGLDDIRAVHEQLALPIFCIGGIKIENLPQVIAAGARRVVIVSGLLQATDIAEYARAAKSLLVPRF